MTPRIVLHAGAPKTGSTYLQKRLRADPALLREHGIYVPVLPSVARMAGNAKLLATALSSEPSLTFRRAFPELDAAALDPRRVLAELLEGWQRDRETAILSAENFRPRHAQVLRAMIPAEVRCTVVLFVRRQDDWIESYHNQVVKVGETQAGLSEFLTSVCEGDGERLCYPDWDEHRRAWHGAFGDCRIVFYDEVRHDVFGAFAAAAELTVPAGLVEIAPVQVSLDGHQLAYLMQLGAIAYDEFVRRRVASAEASRRIGPPPVRTMLTAADRARLAERFAASNRRLLEALGRSSDDSPLRMTPPAGDAASFEDVYASEAYAEHQRVADAIFAGTG